MTKQEGEGGLYRGVLGGGGGGGCERANLFSVYKWALKTRLKNMGN